MKGRLLFRCNGRVCVFEFSTPLTNKGRSYEISGFDCFFTGFLLGLLFFYRVPLGLIRFRWVLMGFTGLYWVVLGFNEVLLGFNGFQ